MPPWGLPFWSRCFSLRGLLSWELHKNEVQDITVYGIHSRYPDPTGILIMACSPTHFINHVYDESESSWQYKVKKSSAQPQRSMTLAQDVALSLWSLNLIQNRTCEKKWEHPMISLMMDWGYLEESLRGGCPDSYSGLDPWFRYPSMRIIRGPSVQRLSWHDSFDWCGCVSNWLIDTRSVNFLFVRLVHVLESEKYPVYMYRWKYTLHWPHPQPLPFLMTSRGLKSQ